jgi:hypothetical protein
LCSFQTSKKNQQTKERKNELLATNKAELQLLSENKKSQKQNKCKQEEQPQLVIISYLLPLGA